MRKSRTIITNIDKEIYNRLTSNPDQIVASLETLEVPIPSWTTTLLACLSTFKQNLDVALFEDSKDFMLWYSKILLLKGDNIKAVPFNRDMANWILFEPPTLIGVSLRTKLR